MMATFIMSLRLIKEPNMEFHIENMTCGACVRRITKAIQTLDENAEIIADTPNRHLKVSTMAMEEDLRDKLVEIGYPAR